MATAAARGGSGWVSSARSSLFAAATAATGTRRRGKKRYCTATAASMSGTRLQLDEAESAGKAHTYEVVFVRHGQSTWNKANRFIGWTDAELTEEGEIEARVAGQVDVYGYTDYIHTAV